jgi:hypothetical protein
VQPETEIWDLRAQSEEKTMTKRLIDILKMGVKRNIQNICRISELETTY